MKDKLVGLAKEAFRAAVAAIIGVVSAFIAGCTTINIPADDARPASFNGITTFRVTK